MTTKQRARRRNATWAAVALGSAALGCADDAKTTSEEHRYFENTPGLPRAATPTFEQFANMTRTDGFLGVRYLVQEDLPVHSDAELRTYYDALVARDIPKLALGIGSSIGLPPSYCDADPMPWHCVPIGLSNGAQLGMGYCVSDEFQAHPNGLGGTMYDTLVQAMEIATYEWQQGGNLWFTHVDSEDDNCSWNDSPPGVYVRVVPKPEDGAFWNNGIIAFWPGAGGSVVNAADTFMHELGHALGFTHEEFRPDWEFACPVDGIKNLIPLTPEADPLSIMLVGVGPIAPQDYLQHCVNLDPSHPHEVPYWCFCQEFAETNYTLSDGDRYGASVWYGIPAALHAASL